MKRFIAYISLQQKEDEYQPITYECKGDCPLSMVYGDTRLPVVPVMNSAVSEGETIQVVLVAPDTAKSDPKGDLPENPIQRNIRWSKEEIETWAKAKNIECKFKYVFYPSASATIRDSITLLRELIKVLNTDLSPEDICYADMTFGIRTMTMIMLYALRYMRTVKNIPVYNIVYGQANREGKVITGGELHDVTALFDMESIFSLIGEMNIPDPSAAIELSFEELLSKEDDI